MDPMSLENIRRAKYRYLRRVDLKRWDELGDTLTEDAVADYGTRVLGEPLHLTGRDEIVSTLGGHLASSIITVHSVIQPEIDVRGDDATGSWLLQDTSSPPSTAWRSRRLLPRHLPAGVRRRLAHRAHELRADPRDDDVAGRPAVPAVHSGPTEQWRRRRREPAPLTGGKNTFCFEIAVHQSGHHRARAPLPPRRSGGGRR